MLNNELLFSELFFSLTIQKAEKGVKILTHLSISCAQRFLHITFDNLCVVCHGFWQVKQLRVELKVESLKCLSELLHLLGSLHVLLLTVVINAKVNELFIQVLDNLPACLLILLLHGLCVFLLSSTHQQGLVVTASISLVLVLSNEFGLGIILVGALI